MSKNQRDSSAGTHNPVGTHNLSTQEQDPRAQKQGGFARSEAFSGVNGKNNNAVDVDSGLSLGPDDASKTAVNNNSSDNDLYDKPKTNIDILKAKGFKFPGSFSPETLEKIKGYIESNVLNSNENQGNSSSLYGDQILDLKEKDFVFPKTLTDQQLKKLFSHIKDVVLKRDAQTSDGYEDVNNLAEVDIEELRSLKSMAEILSKQNENGFEIVRKDDLKELKDKVLDYEKKHPYDVPRKEAVNEGPDGQGSEEEGLYEEVGKVLDGDNGESEENNYAVPVVYPPDNEQKVERVYEQKQPPLQEGVKTGKSLDNVEEARKNGGLDRPVYLSKMGIKGFSEDYDAAVGIPETLLYEKLADLEGEKQQLTEDFIWLVLEKLKETNEQRLQQGETELDGRIKSAIESVKQDFESQKKAITETLEIEDTLDREQRIAELDREQRIAEIVESYIKDNYAKEPIYATITKTPPPPIPERTHDLSKLNTNQSNETGNRSSQAGARPAMPLPSGLGGHDVNNNVDEVDPYATADEVDPYATADEVEATLNGGDLDGDNNGPEQSIYATADQVVGPDKEPTHESLQELGLQPSQVASSPSTGQPSQERTDATQRPSAGSSRPQSPQSNPASQSNQQSLQSSPQPFVTGRSNRVTRFFNRLINAARGIRMPRLRRHNRVSMAEVNGSVPSRDDASQTFANAGRVTGGLFGGSRRRSYYPNRVEGSDFQPFAGFNPLAGGSRLNPLFNEEGTRTSSDALYGPDEYNVQEGGGNIYDDGSVAPLGVNSLNPNGRGDGSSFKNVAGVTNGESVTEGSQQSLDQGSGERTPRVSEGEGLYEFNTPSNASPNKSEQANLGASIDQNSDAPAVPPKRTESRSNAGQNTALQVSGEGLYEFNTPSNASPNKSEQANLGASIDQNSDAPAVPPKRTESRSNAGQNTALQPSQSFVGRVRGGDGARTPSPTQGLRGADGQSHVANVTQSRGATSDGRGA